MVTSSTASRALPGTCPYGCFDGYLLDLTNDAVTMCRCEIRRVVTDTMHEDVRTAKPTIEHGEWVMKHAKALERAVLAGSKADVLAVARCVHVGIGVDQRGRFDVMTDREIVKLVTASWRANDAEAEAVDERIVWPDVLVIWLGSLRDGPRASPEVILDAVKIRREARHVTWLAHDPGRRCWLREQEGWMDVQEHIDAHYVRLEVPRVLGKAVPATNVTPASDTMPPTPAMSKAASRTTPVARVTTLAAKVPGPCSICRGSIERGDAFVWADGQRNRAHPSCMPST